EKMVENNWTLGGENSGHIIIADKNTTGDGIVASLDVLAAMAQHKLSLNELASAVKLFPQVLINVRFAGGENPLENAVKSVAAEVEKRLEGKGRILLRKSGTEPLIRVMVECQDAELAQ
ncbi:phosphoglucosamine mutase, partial [Haemophilus influenzae]